MHFTLSIKDSSLQRLKVPPTFRSVRKTDVRVVEFAKHQPILGYRGPAPGEPRFLSFLTSTDNSTAIAHPGLSSRNGEGRTLQTNAGGVTPRNEPSACRCHEISLSLGVLARDWAETVQASFEAHVHFDQWNQQVPTSLNGPTINPFNVAGIEYSPNPRTNGLPLAIVVQNALPVRFETSSGIQIIHPRIFSPALYNLVRNDQYVCDSYVVFDDGPSAPSPIIEPELLAPGAGPNDEVLIDDHHTFIPHTSIVTEADDSGSRDEATAPVGAPSSL